MLKNVAGQKIGAQLVSATDGSNFTGAVTIYVTGDAGTQAAGSVGAGACTHEGKGYHTYAPAQAETNYDLVAFTFEGSGAVTVTVQVYTLPTTGILAPATAGRTLVVDGSGLADANMVKHGPTGSGSAITAGSIPAAVAGAAGGLFISGTNSSLTITGQLVIQDGIAVTCTTNGRDGMRVTGTTTGHGFYARGGVTSGKGAFFEGRGDGDGFHAKGGSTDGAGAFFEGPTDSGLRSRGGTVSGLGSGIEAAGSYAGIAASGNVSGCIAGVLLDSVDGPGLLIQTTDATENAVNIFGGGTSGSGISIATGDGHGIDLSGINGSGKKGINGTLSGPLDTLTTYTGNTPQTGDSYAIVNSGTHGNAAIKGFVDDIGVAGAGLTAIPWNASWDAEVQSEVDDAIIAKGLDHLVFASVTGTDIADNSIIAYLASKSATADWDTFVNTTDSLEANRDNIGTAGAGLTEAGGDGDQLTAINLPDQSMNIIGNITGNLSGTVGSVTGAVGSVAGNVSGNVTGTIGGLTAAALKDFFDTDSATTYASAVAGSVVKEIADNAGGGTPPTAADIADAVWDEILAGHAGVGSTGAALSAAGGSGDPWATALPGAYGAGTAGKIIGDNINATVSSRATPAQVNTEVLDVIGTDTLVAGVTVKEALRRIGAITSGKVTGAGTGSETFKDFAESASTIVITVDGSGNRSAITYN